tara:strand:- start:96 stop:2069 length:1974 start_codon:yes stop_codon:yes gene_type:complete
MKLMKTLVGVLLGAGIMTAAPAPPGAPVENDVSASMRFEKTQLDLVLDVFGELTGRSLIRPSNLPQIVVDFKPQGPMSERDAVEAIKAILAINELGIVPLGDKFAQILPANQLEKDSPPFLPAATSADLQEDKTYVSHIVHLKHTKPSEVAEALKTFSRLGQNSIIALDDSRTLLLRDYAVNIKRMLQIVEQIDVEAPSDEEFEIIDIKYALAADVASVISNLTDNPTSFTSSTQRQLSGAGSGGSRLGGGASNSLRPQTTGGSRPGTTGRTVARPATSSTSSASSGVGKPILGNTRIMAYEPKNAVLVITENKAKMALVRKFIDELDQLQPMVLIEAIIMDIALDDNLSFGMSLSQDKEEITGSFGQALGSMHGGGVFKSKLRGSGATTDMGIIENLSSGLNYWGFIGNKWEVAVNAIKTDTRVNILSTPRIQTTHAKEAELFIGETHPYIASSTVDPTGGSRSNYQQKQIGINLRVLPFINPDGLVVMDIQQTIGDIISNKEIDGNQVPITTDRTANANLYVRDGDAVVLGGFIKNKKTESKSGIPYLKDVPVIGPLFRDNTDKNERQELVVLMRPTVLETPEAVSAGTQSMYNEMPLIGRAKLEARSQEIKYRKMYEEEKRKAEKGQIDSLRPPTNLNPSLFKGLDELERNQGN